MEHAQVVAELELLEEKVADFPCLVETLYDMIGRNHAEMAKFQHHDGVIKFTGYDILEYSRTRCSANIHLAEFFDWSDHHLLDHLNENRETKLTFSEVFEKDDPRNYEEIDVAMNLGQLKNEYYVKEQINQFIEDCEELDLPLVTKDD